MTVKRSRHGRSFSSGNTGFCLTPPSPDNVRYTPLEVSRPLAVPPVRTTLAPAPKAAETVKKKAVLREKKAGPGIFSVSSPVHETVDKKVADVDFRQLGGFLEKCCLCRKIIPKNSDIYMYCCSNMQAYCSDECRQLHIDVDNDLKMLSAKPKWMMDRESNRFTNRSQKRGGFE